MCMYMLHDSVVLPLALRCATIGPCAGPMVAHLSHATDLVVVQPQ